MMRRTNSHKSRDIIFAVLGMRRRVWATGAKPVLNAYGAARKRLDPSIRMLREQFSRGESVPEKMKKAVEWEIRGEPEILAA